MRLFPVAARFLITLAVLVVLSIKLLSFGGLPIAPHALPTGDHAFEAKSISVGWWLLVALALSDTISLAFAGIMKLRRKGTARTLRFVDDVLRVASFLLSGVALSAFVFELPISTVFATSSIVAVILGFALQNTVGDLLSGLAMTIEQPFHVGDRIDLGERGGGRVLEMNWRATRILAVSGDLLVVPNSLLSRGRIINHDTTLAPAHRASIQIKLPNDESPVRASEVLRAAAISTKDVLAFPAPKVEVSAYGDWAIDYKVLFYFADWGEETLIASRVYQAVWSHLSWAGIGQPTPRTIIARSSASAGAERTLPNLLKRIPIFEPLSTDERSGLADLLRVHTIPQGGHLIEQDALGQSLFVVREGIFVIRVRDADGVDHEIARLFPGDYVGEASLLTGAKRNATVQALTACAVYEIDKSNFEPFMSARPEMVEMLAAALVARTADRDAARDSVSVVSASVLIAMANQIRAFFRR